MNYIETLKDKVIGSQYLYNKLFFVLGDERKFKEVLLQLNKEKQCPIINLSLILSQKLMNLSIKDRSYFLPEILGELILQEVKSEEVALYHIEALFEPSLYHNPISLLEKLSRKKILFVHWSGEFDGKNLVYGKPGHREYCNFAYPSDMVIDIAK